MQIVSQLGGSHSMFFSKDYDENLIQERRTQVLANKETSKEGRATRGTRINQVLETPPPPLASTRIN
jgi:hypothetical protein